MKRVTVKVSDWSAVAAPFQFLVLGTIAVFGILLFVPFVVAVEVKAWLARRRIRKELLAGQVMEP